MRRPLGPAWGRCPLQRALRPLCHPWHHASITQQAASVRASAGEQVCTLPGPSALEGRSCPFGGSLWCDGTAPCRASCELGSEGVTAPL